MDWPTFHLFCRYMEKKRHDNIPWLQAESDFYKRYKHQVSSNKIIDNLKEKLSNLKEKQIETLQIYGDLNLNIELKSSTISKQKSQYHISVFFVFLMVCIGGTTFIVPQFEEIYLSAGATLPSNIFLQYWPVFIFTLVLLLVWSQLCFWRGHQLLKSSLKANTYWFDRFLLSKCSITDLKQLTSLLISPLDTKSHEQVQEMEKDELNLNQEIQYLIEICLFKLDKSLLNRFYFVEKLFIILQLICIAALIEGLYSPIFGMGTIFG